ncbi:MAG: TRAP transporter permease [Pseudomonadota bacterium]
MGTRATPPDSSRGADKDAYAEQLEELVASDTGRRQPGPGVAKFLFAVALAWALYQLYMASPLPFVLGIGLIDDTQQRSIHLAFALLLGFFAYPAFKGSPRDRVPATDWILASVAVFCTLYIVLFYADVSSRAGGNRTHLETLVSVVGILMVLELTRRSLGIPLVIVAFVFMAYAFLGPHMPEVISHRGVSLDRFVDHMWLTTEGVFGLPLGVSNSFIFLFVLFGALLDKAGAGNFFIKLSFALLGHLRGGPAKAAVVSSGLTGLISGSAIANVVTTGTFTIPLMKRIGFPAEKAGAIEVSSSINGQIMPPVMGAAAFLMTEFVGISYFEVIKHAFLPAIISYIGLFYIVHLEAEKMGLPVLQKVHQSTVGRRLLNALITICSIIILSGLLYYLFTFLTMIFGEATVYVAGIILVVMYLSLLKLAAGYPELEFDDPNAPLVKIPDALPILMAGLYFVIPIGVLVWCLMIERLSPGLSVTWAIATMVFVILTQHPITNAFRKKGGGTAESFRRGWRELLDGMVAGSRNMVGIAIAMAAAGIIVGVVSITGLGLIMTEVIDAVSGGNVMVMLIFTAIMCMVLGMGLPTTANYIVVASVMAQPFVALASQHGIIVPLIAVHLFVFYFGLISGTTPPVAVDAFAGAAVARSDPMKTAINSFFYDIRTSVLPFIFIFNPGLLLIGIDHWWQYIIVVATSVIAMCVFGAATKSYFLTRSRLWESALLLLVAFTLIRPGFWLDRVEPPFHSVDPSRIESLSAEQPGGANIRLLVEGENFSGELVRKVVLLPLGAAGRTGAERLYDSAGLEISIDDGQVIVDDGQVIVDDVRVNSPAQQWGMDFDWIVLELQLPAERMAKQWFYLPAIALLALVVILQLGRRRKAAPIEATSGAPRPLS